MLMLFEIENKNPSVSKDTLYTKWIEDGGQDDDSAGMRTNRVTLKIGPKGVRYGRLMEVEIRFWPKIQP